MSCLNGELSWRRSVLIPFSAFDFSKLDSKQSSLNITSLGVFMNNYKVPLTIKVNPMWYFISGMLARAKIVTRFLFNSFNNKIKRLFNLRGCLR